MNNKMIEQAIARAEQAIAKKRFKEAENFCAEVLAVSEHPAALAFLGYIATQGGDAERGVTLLSRALQLQPENANWHSHLGLAYRRVARLEEAKAVAERSVRLDAASAQYLVNLANIYIDLDDRERAVRCLLQAVGLQPGFADGHLALSEYLLAQGEFDPGWIEYEWRTGSSASPVTINGMTAAKWNGMKIPNGRLLVMCDQGYGDTIQFARYIPLAAERCQELVLACRAEMAPLFKDIAGVSQCCHFRGDTFHLGDIPNHSAYVLLASLPYLFRTQPDTIPREVPYLKAKPARVAHWRERFAATLPAGAKRIGLAWTGKPMNVNDWRRSMPLSQLASLADAGSAAFVSLQKPMPPRDWAMVPLFHGMTDISEDLTDYGETAAVIENLDLVITVDSSVAHLAGALGKPVWILLPRTPDWRWLLDREDSPWYPTARLFRQQEHGKWDAPVKRMRACLSEFLAQGAEG